MSKVYIVPTQTPGEDGELQNVNWVPERNDVFFDYNDGELVYDHILMTYVDDLDGPLYSIDENSPTSQPIVIGFNPNLQKYVAFTGGGALVGAEISAYYDDEKNYIVPEQQAGDSGKLQNVNWKAGRNDVVFSTMIPGAQGLVDFPATYDSENDAYFAVLNEENPHVIGSISFDQSLNAYGFFETIDGSISPIGKGAVSLWYPAGSVDPDDPDKKPDNIKDHTASKNQVIEAARPAQVRSQVNWMDRVEEIATDILNFDPLDYRVRSIEKYLDEMDGRRNLDPIIRINKDIEKPEDNSDDSTEGSSK